MGKVLKGHSPPPQFPPLSFPPLEARRFLLLRFCSRFRRSFPSSSHSQHRRPLLSFVIHQYLCICVERTPEFLSQGQRITIVENILIPVFPTPVPATLFHPLAIPHHRRSLLFSRVIHQYLCVRVERTPEFLSQGQCITIVATILIPVFPLPFPHSKHTDFFSFASAPVPATLFHHLAIPNIVGLLLFSRDSSMFLCLCRANARVSLRRDFLVRRVAVTISVVYLSCT